MREDEKRIFNMLINAIMLDVPEAADVKGHRTHYEQTDELHTLEVFIGPDRLFTLFKVRGNEFSLFVKNAIGQQEVIELGSGKITLRVLNMFIECVNACILRRTIGERKGDAAIAEAKKAATEQRRLDGIRAWNKKQKATDHYASIRKAYGASKDDNAFSAKCKDIRKSDEFKSNAKGGKS
ncbi:MAG: hypothetical protein Unbinned6354contig1000_40 [Prokaryotic dsDNA virus sp.]|nr:hypothetical protein [Cytophagaceae bacterium]QDP54337.1 MAG: hypothetical protein Unbinned6354contig1000_40 [Prokaryotic dsDNA virus sp.]|tara:strand:- start:593 stop:1135 length:543 start_codon:yes stop_codon:yes gene_type:complete